MNFHLKKGKWILAFCIVSSIIFLSLFIRRSPSVELKKLKTLIEQSIEVMTLDYRFRISNFISEPAQSGKVVIVAIDEKSLKEFGRWPWSRALMAELVKEIIDLNPKVLAVDIFFSEPENEKSDQALGDAFRISKEKIILGTAFEVPVGEESKGVKDIPDEIIDSAFLRIYDSNSKDPVKADNVLQTVSEISQGSLIGHVYSHQ